MSQKKDANQEHEQQSNESSAHAQAAQENDSQVESAASEDHNPEQNTETAEGQSLHEAQIDALEEELAQAKATIEEQKDSVLRARADMENARRRAEQEVDKARKFALERFAGELLPVIDNLERALQSANAEDEAVKPLLEGVELTHKSFLSSIEKFGMQVLDPQGEAFNPDHHQAMSMQESTELAPNTVMAVMQKGYLLNGRLLRPAMVMVSRAPTEGVDTQA
uniref:nucleotide exchange factor GrpE n=1 Tax=Ningiella ruwaisensis TaxID=2364274 RepID=UPI00109FAA84|nr:nucleotide exchange factor GrpE [Ningiella ruwaisensis]